MEEAERGFTVVVVSVDLVSLARVGLEDVGREFGSYVALDDAPVHGVGALEGRRAEHGHDPGGRQGIARSQIIFHIHGDPGGLRLDFVEIDSEVPLVSPFAMPSLPNFHLPK